MASAFHPSYGEKMITCAETATAFKGCIVVRKGLEGKGAHIRTGDIDPHGIVQVFRGRLISHLDDLHVLGACMTQLLRAFFTGWDLYDVVLTRHLITANIGSGLLERGLPDVLKGVRINKERH